MKCKGLIKEKNKQGKEVVGTCNTELNRFAIFCPQCGEPTSALSTDLSARNTISLAWKEFSPIKHTYYGFAIFIIFTGFLLSGLAIYFNRGNYWLTNGLLLLFVPLILLPFSQEEDFIRHPLTIKKYLASLRFYPYFWLIALINIAFFLFLKIVTTGFILGIASDPLLHFVRLIMVLYWLVIIFAAPFLLVRNEKNIWKAFKKSHDSSRELRWQILGLYLMLIAINLIGAALVGLGLLVTIPFTYVVLEKYFLMMRTYQLV